MNDNLIKFFEGGNSETITTGISQIAQQVQTYANIILGALAGLFVLAMAIICAIAFYKGAKSEDENERKKQLDKVKWVFIGFIAILIIWALTGAITGIMQNAFMNGTGSKAELVTSALINF
ncbi:Mbov_0395 family pilin-like conjugal transfer protein [Mycoplasma sp. B6400]|uniref:Mbov_0395 family pilin-like conjugal transfer protein n=1 Tax=unclassified Mycoplasma TaxID=2683645 RepID=UPI003AAD5AB7